MDISKFRPERIGSSTIENGRAFQILCFDLLRSSYNDIFPIFPGYILTKFPATVKDGGIDIAAEGKKSKQKEIFFQCKLGLGKNVTADGIIENIIIDLKKNLTSQTIPGQYKPWQQSKSLNKYVVCLARQKNNLNIEIRNQEKLKSFFLETAKKKDFEHLSKIEIKILFWNELEPILEEDAYLFHKWVKVEPSGLKVLKPELKNKKDRIAAHFTDYLREDYLHYITRKKFAEENLSIEEKKTF